MNALFQVLRAVEFHAFLMRVIDRKGKWFRTRYIYYLHIPMCYRYLKACPLLFRVGFRNFL